MFKKLTLQNWKSFRYAELPIDSLTILIGTNASGKSNVVDAFEFLKRVSEHQIIEHILIGGEGVKPIRGSLELFSHKLSNEFTLALLSEDSETEGKSVDLEYEITVQTSPSLQPKSVSLIKISIGEDGNQSKQPIAVNEFISDELSRELLSFYKNLIAENIVVPKEISELYIEVLKSKGISRIDIDSSRIGLSKILILSSNPENTRLYSAISYHLNSDGSNLAGFIASLEPDRKAQLESQLTEYLNHLPELEISKVWVETVGRLNSDAMIYCEEKWGNSGEPVILDARSMSDGTLRFLTIMTAILTRPSGSQLIIEEIDNGLHPSRAKFLIELLRDIGADRQVDVLITTHNSALLDALEPDMMPFVIVAHRDQETGESKLTPLDELEDLPKLLASGTLGNLVTRGAIERSISRHASP